MTNRLSLTSCEYHGDSFDEAGQEFVDTVVTATGRLQSMVSGLFGYLRATTRGGEFGSVDTENVVDEVSSDLEHSEESPVDE